MTHPRKFAPAIAAIVLLALPFVSYIPDYWIALLDYIGIASLGAIGLVVLTGVGGMTSFGQATFVGCAAYTSAVVTIYFGWSPWLALPLCLLMTAIIAGMVGSITVNLSGHFLPLSTLAWGTAIFYLFGNATWLGGYEGLRGIPPLSFGSYALIDPRYYFVVVWVALVLTVVGTGNLLHSRIGRAIRSLRTGSVVAEAFGVRVARVKLQVFVYCALLSGLAGWLYAHFLRSVSPGPFGVTSSIEYLLMAVVGGPGRIFGGILGAASVTLLRDRLQTVLPWLVGTNLHIDVIVFGAALVFSLQFAPKGIWPIIAGPTAPIALPPLPSGKGIPTRAQPTSGITLLELRNVSKAFGGLAAVRDVSLAIKSGDLVGLIGPNGAGKTTLFNLITGVLPLTAGEIVLEGKSIQNRKSFEIAELGLSRTFQHPFVVSEMTVVENVALGSHLLGRSGFVRSTLRLNGDEEAVLLNHAAAQLKRVGLGAQVLQPAGTLALGQLRLMEIARALSADPTLLLLDEPAAGLRFGEKRELAALLRELKAEGISILLVEHDMEFIMNLVDWVAVVDFGAKIAEGRPAEIRRNPAVVEAYLGGAT